MNHADPQVYFKIRRGSLHFATLPTSRMTANDRHRVSGNLTLFRAILPGICFLGGLWNCWRLCYAPDTDEICYLNIGEAFLRGDGSHFLSSMWGPLYGVVSIVWLRILPGAYPREDLKVMNLCILLLILWGSLAISKRIVQGIGAGSLNARVITQVFVFSALWVSLDVLAVARETPDLMLMAVVLASTLSYLRFFDGSNRGRYLPALTVGVCGAAGYYLKQSYLPVALLFLAALVWPPADRRIRLSRVGLASAAFLVLILPWIAGLSAREGHLTMGENAKFNYLAGLENADQFAALFGALPPENRLPADPTVVDLGSAFPRSQFPLQCQGTDYLANVPIHFSWRQQLTQSRINYVVTINLFRHKGPFAIVLVLVLVAGLCLRKPSLSSPWLPLMVISLAPFILYPLVRIDYRYLAPYLFLGAVSAWAWATSENPNIPRLWALLLGCCLLGGILWDTVVGLRRPSPEELSNSFRCCSNPYEVFREELHAAGIPEGAKIALVGEPRAEHFYSWVNPGRYRLQAVVTDPSRYFGATQATRRRIEDELSERGSQVLIVPRELVPQDQSNNWRPLSIGYMFRLLGNPHAEAERRAASIRRPLFIAR